MLTPQQGDVVAYAMEWALKEIPDIPEDERQNTDTVLDKDEKRLTRADFMLVLKCLEAY